MREMKNEHRISKDHLEGLDVDGRMLLKWILNK
jgi:hypothetical protein